VRADFARTALSGGGNPLYALHVETDVVTKLRSIALLLLLALALRLGAGPHPCHGTPGMQGMPKAGACHSGASGHGAPPAGENDCCKKGHALCENACQTAAVLHVVLASPGRLPFEERTPSPEDRSLPLFVLAIDHVPLS
jgi:hypothetical protein